MRRTVFVFIFTLTIYAKTSGWTMRQNFNYFNRPKFHTISASPTFGPMFLSVKPRLTVLPNDLPIIPSDDELITPEPMIVTEKTEAILHKVHKRQDLPVRRKGPDEESSEEDYEYETVSTADFDSEEIPPDVYEEAFKEIMYPDEDFT